MATEKQDSLADQERVFLLARGDALLELVRRMRDQTERDLQMLDGILKLVGGYDANLEIPDNAGKRLVNLLRTMKPKETAGLSDEEVIKQVGGLNGTTTKSG